MAVLGFDDLSGRPIAIFSNYGVHGVVMGLKNREVTGDLPGATARFLVLLPFPDCVCRNSVRSCFENWNWQPRQAATGVGPGGCADRR